MSLLLLFYGRECKNTVSLGEGEREGERDIIGVGDH